MMQTNNYEKAAAEIAPRVKAKIDSVQGAGYDDKAKMRSVASEMLEMLLAVGLVFKEVVNTKYVGVHPENRQGAGVDSNEVHLLLALIIRQGFTWLELAGRVWATQLSPGKEGADQRAWNKNLVEKSAGLLAGIDADMRLLTIAGSHTTQTARCVQYGTRGLPATGEEADGKRTLDIWDESGHIVPNRVYSANEPYRELVEKGIEYTILRHQICKAVPSLPGFLSEAANRGHGTERERTIVQTLLAIHQKSLVMTAPGGDPDWDGIAESMARNSWVTLTDVKEYCLFVKNWSGGKTPTFLLELNTLIKSLQSMKLNIQAKDMAALSKVKLAEHPQYIIAVVKAMLAAPDPYKQNNVSRLMTATDMHDITSARLTPMCRTPPTAWGKHARG